MMDEALRQRLLAFLGRHDLAALATVAADRAVPACAIVEIAVTDGLEIVFGTPDTTRKYRNLQANPHVALMIGWNSATGSMQYEGMAEEIAAGRLDAWLPRLGGSDADRVRFATPPGQRFFVVRPTWIRFFDVDRTDEVVIDGRKGDYPLGPEYW
jgi:hypothetical protein